MKYLFEKNGFKILRKNSFYLITVYFMKQLKFLKKKI